MSIILNAKTQRNKAPEKIKCSKSYILRLCILATLR